MDIEWEGVGKVKHRMVLPGAPPEGFRPLFDGKTLAGWQAKPRVQSAKPPKGTEPVTDEKRRLLAYAAPVDVFLKTWKFGDWNTFKIRCEGELPHLTTWINGTKICELNTATMKHPGFDKKAVAALLGSRGYISLEVHSNGPKDGLGKERWAPGAVCRWRNIFVKPLEK